MTAKCFLLAAALVAISLCPESRTAPAPPVTPSIAHTDFNQVGKVPPADTLKLSLQAARTEFFLGENILLHYCIENLGKEPIGHSVGGDYRGGSRADRFKVTVVDSAGREMPDPQPKQFNMGGLIPLGGIKPGQTWFEVVFLLRYRSLGQPGDYTVTVFHDLGWGPRRTNDFRVVSIRLKLKMPTVAEAAQVIAAMEKAKSYNGKSWGKKGQPTADFSLLKFPVYLPLLSAAANLDAVAGLAKMPGIEATRALLSLAETPGMDVPAAAAAALSQRIPVPEKRRTTKPNYWNSTPAPVPNTWDPTLASDARRIGMHLISHGNDACLVSALGMLTGLAAQEDLPELFQALERSAWRAHVIPATDKDHHQGPRWACRTVTGVLDQFARGGLLMPVEPGSAGEFLGFLAGIAAGSEFWPVGWEATFARALGHERAVVREAALWRVPQPVPATLVPLVLAGMSDPEPFVRKVACERVNQLKLLGGRDHALKAIAMAADGWTVWMAVEVAVRDHGRVECAELLARRFAKLTDDPHYLDRDLMGHLVRITMGGSLSGSWHSLREPKGKARAEAMREAWLKVIRQHAATLRTDQLLKPGDVGLSAGLIPAEVAYQPPQQ